jgi:HEAT repeat protein
MVGIPREIIQKLQSKNALDREYGIRELAGYDNSNVDKMLVERLADSSPSVVHAAATALQKRCSPETVAALVEALSCDDATIRNQAAALLGKIGTAAAGKVVELLRHHNKEIRKFAIDILRTIRSRDTEDHIINALRDDDVNVAAAAAECLGHWRTAKAAPFLAECLHGHTWVKCAALQALGDIGGKEALDAIISSPPQEDPLILFCAITALEKIGDARGVAYILDSLQRAGSVVESMALQALAGIMKKSGDDHVEEVKAKLPPEKVRRALQSDNRDLVRSAIRLLGLYKDRESVPLLIQLYRIDNQDLLPDIEDALVAIQPDDYSALLKKLTDPMESEALKKSAVTLLVRLGGESALALLQEWFWDVPEETQCEIIRQWQSGMHLNALETLHKALQKSGPNTKEKVIECLASFADPSSISHLFLAVEDHSDVVRQKAAEAAAAAGKAAESETAA